MDNRFFKLPYLFDAERLRQDLDTCVALSWPQHFNKRDYEGSWTSIALRSASGLESDIYTVSARSVWIDTPILSQCPYFQDIMNELAFEKETVRLLALAPGSRIREHTDQGLGYRFNCFRLHIPITTDEKVAFVVDGSQLNMQPGECWYADFSLPHSVTHDGTVPRIHLVIDGLRNAWTDAVFQSAGYDFELEKRLNQPDQATLRKIIAELERRGTPEAEAVAAQMRGGLQEGSAENQEP